MPKGPCEASTSFYARRRLAYSTMAIHAWAAAPANGASSSSAVPAAGLDVWHFYCSRVLERTPEWAVCIVTDVLKGIDTKDYTTLTVWTDAATQFKSRCWMGSLQLRILQSCDFDRVHCLYGCPKHFKSSCDREFARLASIRAQSTLSIEHKEVDDVVTAYNLSFIQTSEQFPNDARRVALHFVPPAKTDVPIAMWTTASVGPILNSFAFSVTRLDRRRANLASRTDPFTYTGLWLRNSGVRGASTAGAFQTHPVLDISAAEPEPDADGELEPACGNMVVEDITMQTKVWKGWRMSYAQPETPVPSTQKHLIRQALHLKDPLRRARAPEGKRHRPMSLQQLRSQSARQVARGKTRDAFWRQKKQAREPVAP